MCIQQRQLIHCWANTNLIYILQKMTAYKKTMAPHFLLLILLTFHAITNAQQIQANNQATYSSVGDVVNGQTTLQTKGEGFHVFKIDEIEKKYLFFDLKPIGQSAFLDIELFAYRGEETVPFKICKRQEVDSCFVSQSLLTKRSQIFVIVDCKEACKYELKLWWSNIEHLNPGDNLKFMFSEQRHQLYHLQLENVGQFAELRLIIKPQTRRQMFDMVKLYGKYGIQSTPSATDYDFKSMHLWQDAQGIYLQSKELRQKNMNILVVGSSQTVYVMTCQIVNKTTHEMFPGKILDEYLQPQQVADYHINFTSNVTDKIEFDQYVFKFSGFNGNMSIGFYQDSAHTKEYAVQPYEYMSDAQFIFSHQQVISSLPNGLYLQVKSQDRISTYSMQFMGRSLRSSTQLKENIYEISEVEYSKTKLFYFNSFFFQNNDIFQDKFSYTLHMINVKGKHGVTVRVCQNDLDLCIRPQSYLTYSQVIDISRYDQIGTKKTFRFQIPKIMLTSINQAEQKLTILIVVENLQNSTSLCALQYYYESKYQILRQSRPIQTRLRVHQTKLFKFTNVDKKIKEIRIHINRISGVVNVMSLRDSPDLKSNGKKETSNLLSFKQQILDKPIFLILIAQEDAIVSIDVQLVHENVGIIAAITMQEDVEFKIKLPPHQVQFLEVHPLNDAIYFDYKASGLVMVCEYINGKCKRQVPYMGVEGSIQVENLTQKVQLIMIQNPSDTKTVQFTAIYHSADYQHCEHKQAGVIYNEIIEGKNCFSFPLTQLDQLQVMITRLDLGDVSTGFLLCSNIIDLKPEGGRNIYRISTEQIQKYCKDQEHKVLLAVVSVLKSTDGEKDQIKPIAKTKIIAQYINQGAILLPDGVAYQTSKTAKQQVLQSFYYQILNKINTTVIVTNKMGNSYFTARLVRTVDRHKSLQSSVYDFTSNSTNYYQNPLLTVTLESFEKSQCKDDCTLLIKVYSKDKVGSRNDFIIQVTQNYVTLEQHKMKDQFLTKDSIAYYSFYNKGIGNSLLVEASDNNKKCLKIMLGDKQYPSQRNNLQVEYGNQLIYENVTNKTYFIAVQALETCGYSISVSCTNTHITHLQRGKLGYLKLQQGQVKYFIIHRLSANPFKILSIHVYGQLQFYLNQTSTQQLATLINQKSINYTQFKTKGEYKNRLIMQQKLCENCYYILACVAKKNTDTSIFLGDTDSFLPISDKKSINDHLKHDGDSLKGYYYDVHDVTLKVKVHSGNLQVNLKYYQQTYQKEFQKLNDIYTQQVKLKPKLNDWSPATIELIALTDDTLYSISFQSKNSTQLSNMVDQTEIIPGQPNYIYFSPERVHCLKGYWRDQQQTLMITADQLYEHGLKEIKIQVVANGTQLKFDKALIRNILSINVPVNEFDIKQALKYTVCLSSEQTSFGATVFQTEDVNILPPDVETVAYGNKKYAIRPEGNFLVDVFECIGKATLTYSQSLKDLPTAKPNSLSILGMSDQPHAFKIFQYQTTFLQIDSQMSTVRWIPIDQKSQTGLGYLHYKVGSLKYYSNEEAIGIQWEGLESKTESHTRVQNIQYIIYISNQTDILQSAQNCDYLINSQKIFTLKIDGGNHDALGTVRKNQIKKSDLTNKYPSLQNLFVSIVAEVDIQPIKGDQEQYRFFYTKQQIPKDVFVQSTGHTGKALQIGVIVAGVAAFLIVVCVFVKVIFPMLARLKNRMFVEEAAQQQRKDQQLGDVPPPSSERKTMQGNYETEEQMSDQVNKQ